MRKLSFFLMSFLLVSEAFASFSIPHLPLTTLSAKENALKKAGLSEFKDDAIEMKNFELNESQKREARVWELTEDEEKRYLILIQNRSGIYYKNLRLTPIDILGLNARDDAERAHFAELAARQEAQKVAQNIVWNNVFHEAYNKLFSSIPVVGDFDPSPYSPYAHQPIEIKEGEHLYFFVKPEDAARTIVMQLVDALMRTKTTQLHILFLEMDETYIQLWANRHQIPKHLLESHRITFNMGEQQYDALNLKNKETPILLLSRGQTTAIVDLGRV